MSSALQITPPTPVIWMTGLPGAGKSTLANALHQAFTALGSRSIVLDGDVLRKSLCSDLDYSETSRIENIRRTAHVAKLFQQQGFIVLVATISPSSAHRTLARSIVGHGFIETYIRAPLALCMKRDPKGMYAKAQRGEMQQFTGVSANYDAPLTPDWLIDTTASSLEEAVGYVLHMLPQETSRSCADQCG
ncbi:adenylyl-sulfate kinase [Paraburkholderia hayleyella]|uniref:adenylyl-sulfate kinase n=1 Tax=Paraburkholderia hayleyella TaxID=2152889 RepID=UPI001FE55B13|nr:adenylyl-sulfate kinase [Paraburkholderia hayleyella]